MPDKPTYGDLKKRVQELEQKVADYEKKVENQRVIDIRQALIEFADNHTLDSFLKEALDVITRYTGSSIGFYHFVEPDQKTLSLQQWSTMTQIEFCKAEGKGMHYSIDKAGVWVDCVYAKAPVIHNDYASLPHKKGMPEGHVQVVRELVVPVMRKDKVMAILGVGNKLTDYTRKDSEIVSYFADVTWEIIEKKKAEKALLDEKLRSEEYINSLPGLFYVFDDMRLVTWNSELKRVTGYTDEELTGKLGTDFVADKDKPLMRDTMQKAYLEGAGEAESDLKTKQGRYLPFFFTGVRKKLDGKDYIIGLGIDNTERKRVEAERQRLQEKLQQSYKMEAIGALAGGIAHKFNNYLSGISGNIELLKILHPSISTLDKYTDRINTSIFNMANLSNQLLAYAEGGKYRPKILSLVDFIENALSIITHKLPRTTQVETDLPGDALSIEGDPIQIQMILSAVIENAAEAIDDDGSIRIIVTKEQWEDIIGSDRIYHKPGPYIRLKVVDNGKGMDQETQRRIFEPFFTTHLQGRGLGMAAVYGIVKNHNGWIDIQSGIGKGTEVSICFPAVEKQIEKPVKSATQYYRGSGTILLIEDEDMFVEVGTVMLQNMGYHVLIAKCGKDAIHIARTFDGDIAVAIMDMGLPDIDGKDLYAKLMEIRPEMKVIVCSGYSIDGPVREVLDAGARDFIQKPFTFSELSFKLLQVNERRKFKRYKIRNNAGAVFKAYPSLKGRIIDISKGGLSFSCSEKGMKAVTLKGADALTIKVNNADFYIDDLPCSIITDVIMHDDNAKGEGISVRCCIQFGDMTPDQEKRILDFIEQYATDDI